LGDATCSDSSSSLERIRARSAARHSEREESAFARTIAGIKESHEEKIEALDLLSRLCADLPVRERNLIRTLIR